MTTSLDTASAELWTATRRGWLDAHRGAWRSRPPRAADERPSHAGAPALFLDRDGVVVVEVDYLGRPEDVRIIDGVPETIAAARAAGFAIVVVTNQSGIARGYFDWDAFEAVHDEIDRELAAAGTGIDAVYACGYHSSGTGPLAVPAHSWRKPAPGMLLAAIEDLGVDAGRSFLVGDRSGDLAAGKAAGLAAGILVRTGYGAAEKEIAAVRALAAEAFSVDVAADLPDAWRRSCSAVTA